MRKFLLNSLAAVFAFAGASVANAEDHNFEGSYLMSNFYMDYQTEEYSMDDLPLVIGEGNVVQNFANYTPFASIIGQVEGNEMTLTCQDEYFILDIDWDTFHYIILNGETFGDDFEAAPITITYDADSDSYGMSSWMLWDYDPMSGEFEKLGYAMVFGLTPGEMPEEADYTGEYIVTGTKTVYENGVATEYNDEKFYMSLRPDGTGLYEFTDFAGYMVGEVPRGWLGVYGAVYGTDIELQGTDIALMENGDGIKLAGPFMNYDDQYTVTIFFKDEDSGTVSDFSVWEMAGGEPVEILAKWTNLSFHKAGTDAVESLTDDSLEAAPVYYDLRGIKVQNPSNGIYIMKQGNKTQKVLIRK